jgi:hypothetical protein
LCARDAARRIAVMSDPLRQAHLTIGFDGDRVAGELRDERGGLRAFSSWLDLISALGALSNPAVNDGLSGAPGTSGSSSTTPEEAT